MIGKLLPKKLWDKVNNGDIEFHKLKFVKHENFDGPKIEWIKTGKEINGIQLVTRDYIYSLIFTGKRISTSEEIIRQQTIDKLIRHAEGLDW
jgi:hypothetical protein